MWTRMSRLQMMVYKIRCHKDFEYSLESLCVCVCVCVCACVCFHVCFCTMTQKEIDLGKLNLYTL